MKKYRIGFLSAILIFVCMISMGYQFSYNYANERRQPTIEKSTSLADGAVEKNNGYYVTLLHEYVVVYYEDKTTIYELTEIPASSLPDNLLDELKNGKYMKTEEELYAFLENYSS